VEHVFNNKKVIQPAGHLPEKLWGSNDKFSNTTLALET
jgi:hypothetical protein